MRVSETGLQAAITESAQSRARPWIPAALHQEGLPSRGDRGPAGAVMESLVTAPLVGERALTGRCLALRIDGRDASRSCGSRIRLAVDPSGGALTVTVPLRDGTSYRFAGPAAPDPMRNVRAHRIDSAVRVSGSAEAAISLPGEPGVCVYVNRVSGPFLMHCELSSAQGSLLVFSFLGDA